VASAVGPGTAVHVDDTSTIVYLLGARGNNTTRRTPAEVGLTPLAHRSRLSPSMADINVSIAMSASTDAGDMAEEYEPSPEVSKGSKIRVIPVTRRLGKVSRRVATGEKMTLHQLSGLRGKHKGHGARMMSMSTDSGVEVKNEEVGIAPS
jgi:hypothetical protein